MTFIRRGPYAVLASAVILVVGLGGATYAVAQITGADIKDGTVTSADIHNHTLKLKDFSDTATDGLKGPRGARGKTGPSDAYATTNNSDTVLPYPDYATVVSLTPPAGRYVASATGTAYQVSGASATFAACQLSTLGQPSDTGQTTTTIPAGGGYANVATQLTFTTDGTGVLELSCNGTNAGINQVVLTAIKVGALHVS
jgi:hypothetical protein